MACAVRKNPILQNKIFCKKLSSQVGDHPHPHSYLTSRQKYKYFKHYCQFKSKLSLGIFNSKLRFKICSYAQGIC